MLMLVHGAFHGAWCFERVEPELARRGIDIVTVELPLTTLVADAATVRAQLDELDRDVVLLGHSYGGAIITASGLHPRVSTLVYLCAVVPDAGEGMSAGGGPGSISPAFIEALQFGDDGLMEVDPALAPKLFFPDAAEVDAGEWAGRLRRGGTGLGETLAVAAWRHRPTHYIICRDDPVIAASFQRHLARRAGATVHEMPGDHSPFLARPAELADVLQSIVAPSPLP